MRRIKFRTHYGSHLPVLIKMVSVTAGPILELGSGLYSTPFLHWECRRSKRKLVTMESQPKYYDLTKGYQRDYHQIVLIEDWDKADFSGPWSMAFVDHEPGNRRGKDILRLSDCADYIIVHDAIDKYATAYGYVGTFEKFKYRYKYRGAMPYTMILSNKYPLDWFTVHK